MGPIGVFDSGYGGLTVLKEIVKKLPQYDYIYLGDNARAPYGSRSFDTVYHYTLQAVNWFFKKNCPLVILACNTASSKALRTIQQHDLPGLFPGKKVLGVIRPTTEKAGLLTTSGKVGVLGTQGTIRSQSYTIEINKFFPSVKVYSEPCPMWVPLIENQEYDSRGADFFVQKNLQNLLQQDSGIDTILLACTHYPLLQDKIKSFLPPHISIIEQGHLVAASLQDYMARHHEVANECTQHRGVTFFTTDSTEDFDKSGSLFFGSKINSRHVDLEKL